MLSIFKTIDGKVAEVSEITEGTWVNLVNPTEHEITIVAENLQIDNAFIRAALDEEETSRIETEDNNQTLIIIDIPCAEKEDDSVIYSTLPLGIIMCQSSIVTVCTKEVASIQEIIGNKVKNINVAMKTRFLLSLLLRIANRYLQYLNQIQKISNFIEKQLYKSQKNKELIQLLGLEKSLVYFSTSLRATEVTLEKIFRGKHIKMYEDDKDLMEDVLIEFRQAIEMANIYSSILSGTMDAFASVISNNLNVIMKVLTSITILITIPNIVFSFYGMNVTDLPLPYTLTPMIISGLLVATVAVILKLKNLF